MRYKLRTATVAFIQEAARSIAITIPSGTILTVPDGLANAAPLVKAEWAGKSIQIFVVDLRHRGEPIKAWSV